MHNILIMPNTTPIKRQKSGEISPDCESAIINNNSNNNSQALLFCRSRVIRLDKRSEECLGLKINGGNCVGIYVTGFQKQSLAEEAGVRIGDRLLQVKE